MSNVSKFSDPLLSLSSKTPTKLLSLLCQGRNDNYMGNFSWRLSTVLNNHARNLRLLGAENEVEILVADWGSETPFYKTLELSPEARQLVKFLIVPPALAQSYDKDAGFAAPHPSNALARRASGKYLMFSDSDIFIPLDSMTKLLYHARQGYFHDYSLDDAFFWASKYHIPYDLVKTSPFIEDVDAHIEKNWHTYAREIVNKKNFMGCGVSLLMKRELWLQSTGWDERLIYWGWNDIDWHRRLASKYRWDDLELHGMKMFHLEHYADRFKDYTKENPRKANAQVEPTCFAPNPENWGLADHTLHYLDGYGIEVPAEATQSPSRKYARFNTESLPVSVRELTNSNPVYKNVAQRIAFNGHSWFGNGPVLETILQQLKPRTVVEIGSWLGASARFFAGFPFIEKVYCVDHWDRKRVENYVPGGMPEPLMNNMYEQFLANCVHTGTDQKLHPIRLNSVEGAEYSARLGMKFDLIYVDGEHSTYGARRDILKWIPLLAPNGLMCGDDWSYQTEPDNVAGAVVSVAQEKGWQVLYDNNFWLFVPPQLTVQNPVVEQPPLSATPPPAPQVQTKSSSAIDAIIPAEIKNDPFYYAIESLARHEQISTILEIGSSSGAGSTEAFVAGASKNPAHPTLFCIEVSSARFSELANRYREFPFVKCYNVSSVALNRFPAPAEVESFYRTERTALNNYPLEQVIGWLDQDIGYVSGSGVRADGINVIKQENNLSSFDMVLIDGSEFTGIAELDEVYGAKIILLDDINCFKNFGNYKRLKHDPSYRLLEENWTVRNGYAIFKKHTVEGVAVT